jgi:hypothetical protein
MVHAGPLDIGLCFCKEVQDSRILEKGLEEDPGLPR